MCSVNHAVTAGTSMPGMDASSFIAAEPSARPGAATGGPGAGAPVSCPDGRCHRSNVRSRDRGEVPRGARGRRPLGGLVRAVQGAHPDPREGHRRDRRAGGAGQGRRRRQPAPRRVVQRAGHPGRVRHPGRQDRRPVHRRPARGRGAGLHRRRCSPAPTSSWWPTSWRSATRSRCSRRSTAVPGHPGAIVALAELYVAEGRGDDALATLAKIPETAETRRVAALARTGADPDEAADGDGPLADVEATLDGLLPAGEGRRRRPPAVPRPARADGPRRPPHRRLPQAALPPALLSLPPSPRSTWRRQAGGVATREDRATPRLPPLGGRAGAAGGRRVDARLAGDRAARATPTASTSSPTSSSTSGSTRSSGSPRFLARYLLAYARWRVRGYPHQAAYRRIPAEVSAEWRGRRLLHIGCD